MKFVPTVGRKLWYHPDRSRMDIQYKAGEPNDATVVAVNDDGTVNLACFDRAGQHYAVENVNLIQADEPKPSHGNWAEWMPYQVKVMERDQAGQNTPSSNLNPQTQQSSQNQQNTEFPNKL